MKIKFFVVEENVLGCIWPNKPNILHILHASILRGSNRHMDGWMFTPLNKKDMRPATRQDFKDFRIYTKGYEEDSNYDFPAK